MMKATLNRPMLNIVFILLALLFSTTSTASDMTEAAAMELGYKIAAVNKAL